MFESSNQQKLTASKDKGLKPILRFIQDMLNTWLIRPLDEDFVFEFVGLEALSPTEQADLNTKLVTSFKTVDEVRAEEDLPPMPNGAGDVILNPVYLQHLQGAAQMQMGQNDPPGGSGDGFGPGADDGGDGGDDNSDSDFPGQDAGASPQDDPNAGGGAPNGGPPNGGKGTPVDKSFAVPSGWSVVGVDFNRERVTMQKAAPPKKKRPPLPERPLKPARTPVVKATPAPSGNPLATFVIDIEV